MWFYSLFVAVLALAFYLVLSQRGRAFLLPKGLPSRTVTAASALLLAGLGYLMSNILVFNNGDNAYLFVAILGMWMFMNALPFAAATVLSDRTRELAFVVGMGLLLSIGMLAVIALVWSLIIIPGQHYGNSDVFTAHLISLLTLLPAGAAILLASRLFPAG